MSISLGLGVGLTDRTVNGSGTAWTLDATGEAIRNAINDPTRYGETLGPELVTNGTFDVDAAGWTSGTTFTSTAAVVGGELRVTATAAFGRQIFAAATVAGRTYELRGLARRISGGGSVYLGVNLSGGQNDGANTPTTASSTPVLLTLRFTATGANTSIILSASDSGAVAGFDNVSVREVIATGYLLPGLGGVRLNPSARASVAMQQRQDGGWEYAAHNLVTLSADHSVNNGTIIGSTVANRNVVTIAANGVWYKRAAGTHPAGTVATGTLRISSPTPRTVGVRIAGSTGGANGEGARVVSVGPTPTEHSVSMTSAVAQAIEVGLDLRPFIPGLAGVDSSPGEFTVEWVQINFGSVPTAYVPTGASAVYAPAVDWLADLGIYGLRSEPAATNVIRNSAGVGGGPPNTMPTNWSTSSTPGGLTWQVTEVSRSGELPRVRLRLSGTATTSQSTSFRFGTTTEAVAATGQVWTASVFITLVAGSWPGTSRGLGPWFRDGGGAYLAGNQTMTFPTGGPLEGSRLSVTATAPANTAFVQPAIEFTSIQTGDVVDVTFDVACPQLETGSVATSPILTYGTAATRAADALITAPIAGSQQGTLVADYALDEVETNAFLLSLDDGTIANRVTPFLTSGGVTMVYAVENNSASVANITQGVPILVPGVRYKTAMAFAPDDVRGAHAGVLSGVDTSAPIPSNLSRLVVGERAAPSGASLAHGHLLAVHYTPRRLPDVDLQSLTQG